jgi:protein-L-isoaspartate(D-aspartate) O-methyltransferase
MSKDKLIQELVDEGCLKTPIIVGAFKCVDRIDFVPEEFKSDAYMNRPLPIGFNQTISQPFTVAFMLEILSPKAGDKVLDVGAGSGWQSALLAHIVGETGKVIAMEIIPELKEFAEGNISKYKDLKEKVKIILGDGSKGYAAEAPFDRIVAAAAGDEIPGSWKELLKVGGRIVAPVGDNLVVMDKISPQKFNIKEYPGFAFVPLVKNDKKSDD